MEPDRPPPRPSAGRGVLDALERGLHRVPSQSRSGRTPQCVEPALLTNQRAEEADTQGNVQPVLFAVAETDLDHHHHEESDAEASYPRRYAASPPQNASHDGLDDCAQL